jgi:hypothetical protein
METYTSDSDDAPLWQLGVRIITELRSMTFAPRSEQCTKIAPSAIVLRKNDPSHPKEVFAENEQRPGILVILGGQYVSPWEEGNTAQEDVYYEILFAIIDADSTDRRRKLRTHLKWQNQISRRLNQSSLVDEIEPICLGHVTQVQTIDPRKWARHESFVGGVYSRWLSRESNDTDGGGP